MTIVDDAVHNRPEADETGVRWETGSSTARIVICGTLTDAASAVAQEMLLEACELKVDSVVLALESELKAAEYDVLRHLVDVAQRLCWTAGCRLELEATDPIVCEVLAAAGNWPSETV